MIPRRASFWMNKEALSFGSCFFFHFRFPLCSLCRATDCCQSHNALINPTSVSQSAMCQLHALWFGLTGTDCEHRRTIDIFDVSPHVTTFPPALILHARPDAIQLQRGRPRPGQAIHHDPQSPADDHTRSRQPTGGLSMHGYGDMCVVCEGESEG